MQVIPRPRSLLTGLDPMSGLLLALGVLAVILVGRFALAYSRRNDASRALRNTGRWTFAVVGGAFTVGLTGLANAGDIIAQVTSFVASHPFVVSNGGVGLLAWLGLRGSITLGPNQYAGLALGIVGAVFLVQGVSDFA